VLRKERLHAVLASKVQRLKSSFFHPDLPPPPLNITGQSSVGKIEVVFDATVAPNISGYIVRFSETEKAPSVLKTVFVPVSGPLKSNLTDGVVSGKQYTVNISTVIRSVQGPSASITITACKVCTYLEVVHVRVF